MVYVALLRGINVGGKGKVEMAKLKQIFEQLGFGGVKTYINSGNVVFVTEQNNLSSLTEQIEAAIEKAFNLSVKVLVKDLDSIDGLINAISKDWVNDQMMRCDVMFLWKEIDSADSINQLAFNPEVEELTYFPGALVWQLDRAHYTKSRIPRMIGTPFYKQLTIRNINTVRKLHALMQQAAVNSSSN